MQVVIKIWWFWVLVAVVIALVAWGMHQRQSKAATTVKK